MTIELPLVSIVTPSFNQAQFIEETILSVKGQDYPNLEHVVMDGASTDGTVDILRHYENEYELCWISKPDKGQSDALNKGFQLARGDIIGWINSDDTYLSGAIRAAVDYMLAHPDIAWVYGDGYWIDESSRVLSMIESQPFDLKRLICNGQYIVQPTVFFRRQVVNVVGLLDTNLCTTMDYDFFIRIGQKFEAGYIPQVLATRRLHFMAKTMSMETTFSTDAITTLDKTFADKGLPQEIINSKNLAYSSRYIQWGQRCFKSGRYKEAKAHLLHALRLDPRPLKRKTVVALLLLIQSILGLQWYHPGERRARKRQDAFRSAHGKVFVDWFC